MKPSELENAVKDENLKQRIHHSVYAFLAEKDSTALELGEKTAVMFNEKNREFYEFWESVFKNNEIESYLSLLEYPINSTALSRVKRNVGKWFKEHGITDINGAQGSVFFTVFEQLDYLAKNSLIEQEGSVFRLKQNLVHHYINAVRIDPVAERERLPIIVDLRLFQKKLAERIRQKGKNQLLLGFALYNSKMEVPDELTADRFFTGFYEAVYGAEFKKRDTGIEKKLGIETADFKNVQTDLPGQLLLLTNAHETFADAGREIKQMFKTARKEADLFDLIISPVFFKNTKAYHPVNAWFTDKILDHVTQTKFLGISSMFQFARNFFDPEENKFFNKDTNSNERIDLYIRKKNTYKWLHSELSSRTVSAYVNLIRAYKLLKHKSEMIISDYTPCSFDELFAVNSLITALTGKFDSDSAYGNHSLPICHIKHILERESRVNDAFPKTALIDEEKLYRMYPKNLMKDILMLSLSGNPMQSIVPIMEKEGIITYEFVKDKWPEFYSEISPFLHCSSKIKSMIKNDFGVKSGSLRIKRLMDEGLSNLEIACRASDSLLYNRRWASE